MISRLRWVKSELLDLNEAFTLPQAITPLLHKQAPGLVHGMLAASLAVTPCESFPVRSG